MSTLKRIHYPGSLARPLRQTEDPTSKIHELKKHLGVSTDREALIMLMKTDLIGRNLRSVPVGLRGAPKNGVSAEERIPMLYIFFNVRNDREALLALARFRVPGFRLLKPSRSGGPPGALIGSNNGMSRSRAREISAHIVEVFQEMRLQAPDRKAFDIAYEIATSETHRHLKLDPKQIVEACKPAKAKRDEKRAIKAEERMFAELARRVARNRRPN